MMKNLSVLVFSLFLGVVTAKAQVNDAQVEFNKVKRTVKAMDVNYESDIVEESIKNRMAKQGYKPKESKGWYIYSNVNDPQISDEVCDLYLKVDRKSRKEKDASTVYFFTTKPGQDATPAPLAASMLSSDGFYGDLSSKAKATKLERDILDQEAVLKKAEKKYDDLVKDQASLEKKIKSLQDDLESNKQKQQNQKQDVDNQKKQLDQLKGQRGSSN